MTTKRMAARSMRWPGPGRLVFGLFFSVSLVSGVYLGNGYISDLALWLAGLPLLAGAPAIGAEPGDTEVVAVPPDWREKERVNILLLGLDHRPDETGDPGRTDTMIVITIDPFARTAGLLSLPRDLWVPIQVAPDRTVNERINAAYFIGEYQQLPGGGPELARRTVEQLLGVRLHYYALVSFEGFERLIDTLGGVEIEVERPIYDSAYPTPDYGVTTISFEAGPQRMDGKTALVYARTRHADNDFNRSRRQQQVLLAARKKTLQLDLLPRLPILYGQIGDAVHTNMSLSDLVALAALGREIDFKSIQARSLDGPYTEQSPGQFALTPNRSQIRRLVAEMFVDSRLVAEGARVQVTNGTGTPGAGVKVAGSLRDQGFPAVTFGVAEATVLETLIIDRTGKPQTVKRLSETFPGAKVISKPDPASGADVEVILGVDTRLPE